jgi:hypothetical protein
MHGTMPTEQQVTPRTPLEQRALEDLARQDRPSWPANARVPVVCRDWCERCWHRWVRVRTLEHLCGQRYWEELDRGDFALLESERHSNGPLVDAIVRLLRSGDDNLTVIARLVDGGWRVSDAARILLKLDLRTRRLPRFRFLPPLAARGTRAAGGH